MRQQVRSAVAAFAGAAVIAALAACSPAQQADPLVSTLKMNVLGYQIKGNWNPVTTTDLNTFFPPAQAVYETFIQLDPARFEWEPLLAESFEIGEDRLSMRIELRTDVDFTDGTHLDAEAAKTSFEYAMQGPVGGALIAFSPELEVTGEYELVVTTTKTMGTDFLFWFGIVPIASPTAIETDPTGLEGSPVGTGPYVLEEQVADASATFVRNPDYRDPESYPFDQVEFLVFDDPVAVSNALKTGQINAALLDPAYAADVEANGFDLHLGVAGNTIISWLDTEGAVVPALADVRVRQAIAYAFDREAIIDNLEYGYGTVTSQVWGEGSPYYIDGADDTYAYDPDKSRELMADAGYADGFEVSVPTWGMTTKYEPVIAQFLADIGITVTFDAYTDLGSWEEAVASGEYALLINGTSDLWTTAREALPDLYEKVDFGTKDEADAARREIGQTVLDEALLIALSRPAEIWATIPGIRVESTNVNGWPVILRGFTLAD